MNTSISKFIERQLNMFNANHEGIRRVTEQNYFQRIEQAVTTANDNISKCGAYINNEEVSAEEIQKIKVNMPNFRPVIRYEAIASLSDGSESNFILEVVE